MKRISLIFLLILTAQYSFGQVQWETDGIPVRQGVNIEWARSATPISDGSVVYAWSDTRRGDRDTWIQKVNPDGSLAWGETSPEGNWKEGILVNGEINRQEDVVIIDAGNNEVIVAWVDFRHEDAGDIYAQKISADGSLLWDEAGVPLCLVEGIQISLNIVTDENGGAFIIWLDNRSSNSSDIYGTHILSDGSIAEGWEVDGKGIITASDAQNQHSFWEDGNGGAMLVWHDKRVGENENIYAQRILSDGTIAWQENGVIVTDATGVQEKPKIRPDGTGNFFIIWRDKRNESNGDIYAQNIDLNGNLLWAEDLAVYAGAGIQRNPRATHLSEEGAIIVWEDGRNDPYVKDIYAQKINPDGTLAWNSTGISICDADNDQLNPRLNRDANGGAWIIWDDGRISGHPHEDIYIQKVDGNGNIAFETNGKIVCDANGQQFSPLIKTNSNNYAFAVWGDLRTSSTGMHVQIFDPNGNETLVEDKIIYYGLDGDALKFKILENGSQPVMLWIDTRNASIANQIYMQIIQTDGSMMLEEDGEAITSQTGFDQQNFDATMVSESNQIVSVWEEIRGDYKQIYAQSVDMENNSLWSDLGLAVGNYNEQQETPHVSSVTSDQETSYYVGWSDFREGWNYGIMGQRIDADGNLLWDEEGEEIADLSGEDKLTDVVGNFYIWQNELWPESDVYVKKVDEDGDTAEGWDDDGLLVCGAENFQENAKGVLVPDGIFIAWQDKRAGGNDIYGQLISNDGEILWQEDGVPIVALDNDQNISNFLFDEYLYMVWEDFRNGTDTNIYMQKTNQNGTFEWQNDGIVVSDVPREQAQPYLVQNGEDLIVFWQDIISASESDLYAQHITPDGELQWTDDGLIISAGIKNQNKPQAVSDSNGNTFVIWEDTRSSGKTDIYNIYAQRVRIDGTHISDNVISPLSIQAYNYPNPFNPETTIRFEKPFGAPTTSEISIFNLKGQLVKSIFTDSNQANWNGLNRQNKPISTGIYFYQVIAGEYSSSVKKMMLMK